jgi:PhnB protein
MTQLYPFLKFNDGACREAMEFYQSCFGGKIESMTVGESPMAKDMPAEKQGLIIHSVLRSGGVVIVGSDMMRDRAVIGDNVGMSLDCASEKELNDLFAKLSQGGEVFMKPEEMFWGGVFAMVTDKYGVEWMMNFQKKPMKRS